VSGGEARGGKLFEPFTLRGLTLRNRLVRSATAERLCAPDGAPTPALLEFYETLSAGGVGLIVTGHAFVTERGKCHPEMLGAHTDRLIGPLAELAAAAHAGGAAVALQINHGGLQCKSDAVARPCAPSAQLIPEREILAEALEPDEIAEIQRAFAAAARRAREAGFDAVQIHAAHGYLTSQFLSPLRNRRDDRYGGALENRARFLRETIRGVRAAVGPDYPLLIKLGVTDNEEGGLTAAEGAAVAASLRDLGIDAIETSTGARGAVRTRITRPEREAYLQELAQLVRRRSDLPIILVGGLRSRPVMERLLDEGIDLIALSRPLIREPALPRRLRGDPQARAECISCNRCWPETAGAGIGCRRLS
jgi:2,4-dienoyl-CoA reductase-like NADH-dependent reductase (Old Yellow Enzyme family)